jgi:hypothetical protein
MTNELNALKPLTISDIIFGEEYLVVEMWRDNSRYLRKLVIIEELQAEKNNRCVIVRKTGASEEYCHNFADLGLIQEKRTGKRRVFENTSENFKALSRIVADPDPNLYLDLIECSNEKRRELGIMPTCR